ncbi:hypothetical protein ABMA27_014401 [Loxostege sticticalis]|uniref:C-type lectin domain-containing protein n=1 Tax=Loxostege sticticalis TaxID=481309 RepID=A0ABR3I8U2_LOXSC
MVPNKYFFFLSFNCDLFRRDYFFDKEAGGWLKFNPIPVTWEEAVLRCLDEGAILASPLDEGLSKALSAIMVNHGVTPMFTGISNVYARSEYQTMEGVPISNLCISWYSAPKANIDSENCIAIQADGKVTAVSCSENHPFACYKKAGIELGECGPVDNGFELDNRTGSCYKAVNKEVTWSEGFMICARAGAHLAVVNSEIEAKVIWELGKELVLKSPKARWNFVNIGFRAWGEPRTWMTIHGQSLSDAGYTKWAPNEPNHAHERCGSMFVAGSFEDGVLNDELCDDPRKFICEIEANKKAVDWTVDSSESLDFIFKL